MGTMAKLGKYISNDTKVGTIAPNFPVNIVFQAIEWLERDHGGASI